MTLLGDIRRLIEIYKSEDTPKKSEEAKDEGPEFGAESLITISRFRLGSARFAVGISDSARCAHLGKCHSSSSSPKFSRHFYANFCDTLPTPRGGRLHDYLLSVDSRESLKGLLSFFRLALLLICAFRKLCFTSA